MKCEIKDFIISDYIEDLTLCDDIIDYHRKSENKYRGLVNSKDKSIQIVDESVKSSTDVILDKSTLLWKRYTQQMQKIVMKYTEYYEYADKTTSKWTILENTNIQHYKQNEGYKAWHFERGSGDFPVVYRYLVFMTYLNDVDDQGETEFLYQGRKIKPRKGLSLIWPAEWTHTHRGIPSPTEEKIIVTGWYSLVPNVGLQ
jgi:hypothetical protein